MTSIRKNDNIILMYYVNPHLFYFKYKNDERGDDVLSQINKKIEKYVNRHIEKSYPNPYAPEIGEIVICHYISDCIYKWVRARVDAKLSYGGGNKYVLWAVDYGFPIEAESKYIRVLMSDELKVVENGLIFKGGLFEIVPSIVEWNFIESAEETRKAKEWSTRAVEIVEKYLHEAVDITFKCKAFCEDHFFGSLIVRSNTGNMLNVGELLQSLKEAVPSLNFLKELSRLEKPPYWQRQSQNAIYKVYENNTDQSASNDVTSTVWIDDTIKDEMLPKRDDPINNPLKEATDDNGDEKLIELSHQLETATVLSSRAVTNSVRSMDIKKRMDKRVMDSCSTVSDTSNAIAVVPMKYRLAAAQQKLKEEADMTARKQATIDKINKKTMSLTFPAGFIVDTKAIDDKRKFERKDNGGYQAAKKNEECFSIDHADRILVHHHGNTSISRVYSLRDTDFPEGIHDALKDLNIDQIFRIQTIGWPMIIRGASMIFVNNVRSGKTWTYLPAVCASAIERTLDDRTEDGCGPLLIITCASSQKVNETVEYVQHLIRRSKSDIRCFKAYGCSGEEDAVVMNPVLIYPDPCAEQKVLVLSELLNATEIFVTTVPCLHRLMANKLNLFSKQRINTLVFDDIDFAYGRFDREIREIYKALSGAEDNVQIIITSRTWLKILENFYTESDRFILCIGSYIEAAVYAKTEMTLEMLSRQSKVDELTSYIRSINYQSELTILMCNGPDDAQDLLKRIELTSIQFWYCDDNCDSNDIKNLKSLINGSNGNFRLLLCTDQILGDLGIRRAQRLIHFSLPLNWSIFAYRFLALFDHHENIVDEKTDNYKPATSVVFLDERNTEQLLRLIDFMKMRGNCQVPDQVLKFVEVESDFYFKNRKVHSFSTLFFCYHSQSKRIGDVDSNADISTKPFCNNLLTTGVCQGQFSCRDRHVLKKCDRSRTEIPQTGYVKFNIIDIRSPVCFTVRLLEHRPSQATDWIKFTEAKEFFRFNVELAQHFKNEENHQTHAPIALGDLCVVCLPGTGDRSYERAQIVKIEEKKTFMGLTTQWVEMHLVDCNEHMSCSSAELMHLPEKFQSFPHQAVDMRIAGLVPRDYDCEWDPNMVALVQGWVTTKRPHYLQGFIKLSAMNILWVESVDVIELLPSIGGEALTVSVKKNLLEESIGVLDSKPLDLLIKLADKAGLLKAQDSGLEPECAGFTPNEIPDQTAHPTEVPVFRNSDSEDMDLDESNPSVLNWSTSYSDDEECDDEEEQIKKSSTSAHDQDLLGLSKDKWAELSLDQFNEIVLCNFYHPGRIYVRNNCYWSRFLELYEQISEFVAVQENLIALADIKLGENCLARIDDGFGRGKIIKVFTDTDGMKVEVFFVDWGHFLITPARDLFAIPAKFITELPFQAIFCKLIGIRPNDLLPKWSDAICDTIYDNLLEPHSHFYAKSIRSGLRDKYAYGLRPHSYQVILLDETGDVNVNKWIASNGYGQFDPETKHFLFDDTTSNYDSVEEPLDDEYQNRSFDVQFDECDIKKLMDDFDIPYDPLMDTPSATVEEKQPQNDASMAQRSPPTDEKVSPPMEIVTTELTSLHKLPKIKWHQTESLIVLSVSAPDVVDYFLKVTSRTLKICFTLDQERFANLLNLFGCVNAELTSHKLRGLNIVIRLAKTLKGISWPRLVQTKEKNRSIEYNFEALNEFDSNDIDAPQVRAKYLDSCTSSDEDIVDDDDELNDDFEI